MSKNKSTEWFENWFDDWYVKVYQHRDSAEAADFIGRLPIWDDLNNGDHCLDLGCGTGRHTRELVNRGLNVIGLDLSASLLQIALKAKSGKLNSNFVRADMRMLPTTFQFSLVVSLFTSFGYFKTDAEHVDLMQSIGAIIKPKGHFILDLPNPMSVFNYVNSNPDSVRIIDDVEIKEHRWIDYQEGRVIKKISIFNKLVDKTYFESVRLFKREEIERMLSLSGINSTNLWGDYDGQQYDADSPRMIFFGVKIG